MRNPQDVWNLGEGGPAFPGEQYQTYGPGEGHNWQWTGMSLRDYFAGKALQGIISAMHWRSDELCIAAVVEGVRGGKWEAGAAYLYADAMLKERAK